ncbi:MAG: hypothetical protein KDK50_05530 [Chlamydiia bacterium]|nr:hypothetical protein [Chlamydiia bacterium]
MAENNLPKDISSPSQIDPSKSVQTGEETPKKGTAKEPFSSYMNEGTQGPGTTGQPTPMDLAKGPALPTSQPTLESVNAQMKSASSSLGDVNNLLNTKGLKLKRSQTYLLRNKLTDANQNIRSAAQKTGVDVGPPPNLTGRQNPIARFIGLVTDSQKQMDESQQMINKMAKEGQSVSPGLLLSVQVKINKASQQIEYASVLLSNAVSSIKSLFNVQI